MKRAIYPGSFDPITNGHLSIIKRGAAIFDELIVAVLINNAKKPLFSVDERIAFIEDAVKDIPGVKVSTFDGLTVDFASKTGAGFLVRGLRAVSDFEAEIQIAQTNQKLNSDVDTVFLATEPEYAFLSSTIVKEVASYGGDVSKFVSTKVDNALKNAYEIKY